jgi:peptide/nickel transport system substrate-binding protein
MRFDRHDPCSGRRRCGCGAHRRLSCAAAAVLALVLVAGVVAPVRTAQAAFPGGSGKLAFVRAGDIWVADADGSNQTRLTVSPVVDRSPRWSPDGRSIAFASNRDGDFEIFVMDEQGRHQRQLTFNQGANDRFPAWTSDGSRIVYDKDFSAIFEIDVSGIGGERKLADGSVPATSPRGDKIVFNAGELSDMFVLDLADGTRRQILDGTQVGGFNASWSPRANELVTVAEFSGGLRNDIFALRSNGSHLVHLVDTDDRLEFSPVWSPDGSQIAFVGCVGPATAPDCSVYVMNRDGSGERQVLTGITTPAAAVDWQPLPTHAGPAPDPRDGGMAVVGLDQEPPCLNVLLARCRLASTLATAGVALPGAFGVTPTLAYEPVLVNRVDVTTDPFALTYHIRPEAVWSDGVPVGADDFIFSLGATLEGEVQTRAGYELITDAAKIDEKTVKFVFSRPFAAWRTLFSNVLPAHVLQGRDLATVWESEVADPTTHEPIGSGPFLVSGWDRSESLRLSRNPRWWGPRRPFLDLALFRFIPDTNARFQAERTGDVDLLSEQAQLQIADLLRTPGVAVQSAPGLLMEHIEFNTSPAGMPLLGAVWFRQAVAYALDRSSLVPLHYGALGVSYGEQDSLLYASVDASYLPHFARYAHDVAAVGAIMEAHGCSTGVDGIWVCGGVRASLKLATTTGNAPRALTQQTLQARVRAAGIELVADNSSPGVLFGIRLPAGDYELVMFAWQRTADPGRWLEVYRCGGASNFTAHCSDTVSGLLEAADTELDPLARTEQLNQADQALADDVPALPLFMYPSFLAHRTTLHGPLANPDAGPTWNIQDWWTE